jgi:putative (di)nucleoside polyphosphate hydrolase
VNPQKKRAYRRCVGVMLLNREGLVFVGRRRRGENDPVRLDHQWQMPQGGIDKGEDPEAAAFRELEEETGVVSAELIEVAPEWYTYDFPPEFAGRGRAGRYSGQTQLWFALRFTGDESEIELSQPGHKPEFTDWRWAPMAELSGLIVPFKRPVYDNVVRAFAHLAG